MARRGIGPGTHPLTRGKTTINKTIKPVFDKSGHPQKGGFVGVGRKVARNAPKPAR